MSSAKICWDWQELLGVTQIDAGAMRVGDPISDAAFLAVHQPVPIGRKTRNKTSLVDETALLQAFNQEWNLDEPLLVFVTGDVGSGKSHMVRWLKSSIGNRSDRHIVYVEKRNTSLTRVIEKVIEGLESASITRIRSALNDVSAEAQTLEQAKIRLLNELRVLVETDPSTSLVVRTADHSTVSLADQSLQSAREQARVLVGDLRLSEYLQRPGGPIERITRLAMPRSSESDDDVNENDVRLDESDLRVDLTQVEDLTAQATRTISLLANEQLRIAVAGVLDHYLPLAKARVFAGGTTDLLELFADVRREVEERGQELCLFIEDLVLLHGIDQQLAQALTVPAGPGLCRVRAAIAVTSGYLKNVDTFNDRGTEFTMDVATTSVELSGRRRFVANYLNVARLGRQALAEHIASSGERSTPVACIDCDVRPECHASFGATDDGIGYFPFNEHSIDQLVGAVSATNFRPREILRQVIRDGVQVADNELRTPGLFPSKQFGAHLDQTRSRVPVAIQQRLESLSPNFEQECSLRNFYSATPPSSTAKLEAVATFLGLKLTPLDDDIEGEVPDGQITPPVEITPPAIQKSVYERWFHETQGRLPAAEANKIRNWFFNQIYTRMSVGPYGHLITRSGNTMSVGALTISRDKNFVIERSMGGGGKTSTQGPVLEFEATGANALLFENIDRVESSAMDPDGDGSWYFEADRILSEFELDLAAAADALRVEMDVREHLTVLRLVSQLADPSAAPNFLNIGRMFQRPVTGGDQARSKFVTDTDKMRRRALEAIRLRFTQAQGAGASSLLDAGAIYADLLSTSKVRHIEEPGASEALRALREFHRSFSTASWNPIRATFQKVMQQVGAVDSFGDAWKEMSELIETAHQHGLLPHHDSKTRFEEALTMLSDQLESVWRFLVKHQSTEDLDELVWDIPPDSLAQLQLLEKLVTECVAILDHLEKLAARGDREGAEVSRSALSDSFLELADILDEVTRA